MKYKRSGGIILHPTSLPGPDGVGDLGPEAYRWIDFLAETGTALWQVLPLGPTGYGDSPYQCFSAFAGNPYLVSAVMLLDEGLLTHRDLADRPAFDLNHVDYGPVIQWKMRLLSRAYRNYKTGKYSDHHSGFDEFRQANRNWLPDYALFMAIKESQGGAAWEHWPGGLRLRHPHALEEFIRGNQDQIESHAFRQYLFFRQWEALHGYAKKKGVIIIGDAPIFVSADSSDVWSHPDLFYLDRSGRPTVVAGVPPDYFSPTGQLWGNPLYRWDVHARTGYSWWIQRLQASFSQVDLVRLDHFRGFAGYWEIPAGRPTAEIGRWVLGPGADFFFTIQKAFAGLPIIAEDLGEITPDVIELREAFNLPGMKILQFAFSSDANDAFLPHNYPVNCVAYTGTHDNDTTRGWYASAPEKERDFCRRYLARSGEDIAWDMIRAVWASVASMALAPMQDFLSLGSESRMNFPGKASGNWTWRLGPDALDESIKHRIREINDLYGRAPGYSIEKPKKILENYPHREAV